MKSTYPLLQKQCGTKLLALRKQCGRTQKDTAQILRVSVSTYAKWEHGKSMPSSPFWLPISKLYGISLRELFACIDEDIVS